MNYNILSFIKIVNTNLSDVFQDLDSWFEKPADVRQFKPQNGGWTIDEILEHIYLTNHFLLIIIEKGAAKSVKNSVDLNQNDMPLTYDFPIEKLNEIGIHQSFNWMRPEHMEPVEKRPLSPESVRDVAVLHILRENLKYQLARSLNVLNKIQNGEGVLQTTMMSVNNLGKIDVYSYLFFLAKHAERHITQMQKNEMAYISKTD
jgi:DinB superfamily